MADVNLKFTKPETRIEIDRDKASSLGVSTRNIAQTLQYALSGQRMGYFYMNGKQYQILGEINRQQRNTPLDLKSIYVRSDNGSMIQLDNMVSLLEDVAPPQLYRYNRFVSATVSSGLNKGDVYKRQIIFLFEITVQPFTLRITEMNPGRMLVQMHADIQYPFRQAIEIMEMCIRDRAGVAGLILYW